jgi:hypothetical protein
MRQDGKPLSLEAVETALMYVGTDSVPSPEWVSNSLGNVLSTAQMSPTTSRLQVHTPNRCGGASGRTSRTVTNYSNRDERNTYDIQNLSSR